MKSACIGVLSIIVDNSYLN